ncbi:hypothetical protein [Bacillus sp. 03113]|uniref:hypothetical protein n=1 Tax=Bacillus sp. 03113 TaxID=2578211 RepID=UPI0015E8AD7B|nr:hypothetical protein [Bacillus sp. 03113]
MYCAKSSQSNDKVKSQKMYISLIRMTEDVKRLKRISIFMGIVATLIVTIYLYKNQLGAVPFLILSLYFFILGIKTIFLSNKG